MDREEALEQSKATITRPQIARSIFRATQVETLVTQPHILEVNNETMDVEVLKTQQE